MKKIIGILMLVTAQANAEVIGFDCKSSKTDKVIISAESYGNSEIINGALIIIGNKKHSGFYSAYGLNHTYFYSDEMGRWQLWIDGDLNASFFKITKNNKPELSLADLVCKSL